MKKILIIVALSLCWVAAKAQNPKIHVDYDENGNRIRRYHTQNKPAPPIDSSNNKNEALLQQMMIQKKMVLGQ